MIVPFVLSVLIWPPSVTAATSLGATCAQEDSDVGARIAAVGDDVEKLLELADSYAEASDRKAAKQVYQRVVELDSDNEVARKALRHQFYDDRWFESFVELAKYKREEAARMKEKGFARWNDQWVPEADVAYLNLGWTKQADGNWVDPGELERAKQIEEWQAAGYEFRADDNSWIAPEDFDHWRGLEWRCGEEWLDLTAANEFHAKLRSPWQLAGEHFVTWTTCDWDAGNIARWHADRVYPDLVRLFGLEPSGKPGYIVLHSLAQYNEAAGAQQALLPESEGFSSLHGAYYSDLCFDPTSTPRRYLGTGVSYWDRADPKTGGWGPFWLRWAAAQSYIEAIDPSWNTVGQWIGNPGRGDITSFTAPFWGEKRIPRWLRWGAASYCERFLSNPEAAEGADPWDLRTFAFGELEKGGGLGKLDDVFAFKLTLEDIPGSGHMYQEAGLLVAFLLDGAPDDAGLHAVHKAYKLMLASGSRDDVAAAAEALQAALADREPAIRAFAGL